MTINESWKPVPFLEGYYEASNLGNVRRAAEGSGTRVGRCVRVRRDSRGYLYFTSSIRCETHRVSVHRAVVWAFLGPPMSGKTEVNHKNGNKEDNNILNLEWCSRAENCQHAYRTGLRKDQRAVVQWTLDGRVITVHQSLRCATQATGANINSIVRACKDFHRTAGGYRWTYHTTEVSHG